MGWAEVNLIVFALVVSGVTNAQPWHPRYKRGRERGYLIELFRTLQMPNRVIFVTNEISEDFQNTRFA